MCKTALDDKGVWYLSCTGTAGIKLYRNRNIEDVVSTLGADSTFICWGSDDENKIWYWANNTTDDYWGNVPAADLTTRHLPFPNLREC